MPLTPEQLAVAREPALLTASRLKAARACLRLHWLRYIEGWRPAVEDEALRLGTLVHRGLEAWWRATGDERLDVALAAMAGEADPFDCARAEEMMRGYHYRWAAEPYETLAVEVEFQAPLVNPGSGKPSRTWALAGKIDAIVRDPDGRVLVVEHKTSSEDIGPGSDYWRRLRMDGQVSQYYAGARALGYDVQGCLYDVLSKPGIRPLKATAPEVRKFTKDGRLYANQREANETPDEFRARLRDAITADSYQRGEVVRLDDEMREAMQDVWQTGHAIRAAELTDCHPRNPDACVRFGKTCWAFDICTGVASLDDAGRFCRDSNVHPELGSGANGAA